MGKTKHSHIIDIEMNVAGVSFMMRCVAVVSGANSYSHQYYVLGDESWLPITESFQFAASCGMVTYWDLVSAFNMKFNNAVNPSGKK